MTVERVRTIELVVSHGQRVREGHKGAGPGRRSYPVDPLAVKGELARWLSTKIGTTHRADDASQCIILARDERVGDASIEGDLRRLRQAARRSKGEYIQALQDLAGQTRAGQAMYGDENWSRRRRIHYDWPAYDSAAHGSPEGYFEYCAGEIRSLGVPVSVGVGRECCPQSLAETISPALTRELYPAEQAVEVRP